MKSEAMLMQSWQMTISLNSVTFLYLFFFGITFIYFCQLEQCITKCQNAIKSSDIKTLLCLLCFSAHLVGRPNPFFCIIGTSCGPVKIFVTFILWHLGLFHLRSCADGSRMEISDIQSMFLFSDPATCTFPLPIHFSSRMVYYPKRNATFLKLPLFYGGV